MTVFNLLPFRVQGDFPLGSTGSLTDSSDSTYIQTTNPYQYETLDFDPSVLPWSSNIIIRWARVQMRVKNATENTYTMPDIWLFSKGKSLLNQGELNSRVGGSSFGNFYTNIPQVTFTQTDTPLQVTLHFSQYEKTLAGVYDTYQISEASLDIWAIYPPAVTVTAPTGTYTTTANPTITWTYQQVDSDGGPQVAYQWAVYSDDQYNAVGFSPGTGTSVVESGVTYSTLKSASFATPLVNDTYRVYMRVAQRQLGQLHWSAWSFSGFVVNVTPPAAPTVTATADNTNARVKIDISGAGSATSVVDVYQVQHTSDAGVTWDDVRGDLGAYLSSVGGQRTFHDYETPNGVTSQWRARTISADIAGQQLIGAWGTSGSTAWTSTSTWLKVPTQPDLNRAIRLKIMGPEDFPIPQGKFLPINGSLPIVVSGIRQTLPDLQLSILTLTDAETRDIKALLAASEVVLVHAQSKVSGWKQQSRYLAVGSVRVQQAVSEGIAWLEPRQIGLPSTEVERPDPSVYPIILGTRTWGELSAAYATYTLMDAAFTTHGDVRG